MKRAAVFAPGSVSLRMYPHALAADEIVSEIRAQARVAEAAGFDGVMTSEHHGGFPGYLPNPLLAAGWILEATDALWAAACPMLLPLRHWSHVVEDFAWTAARFPGRVGAGFAAGGLEQDFEMAELPFEENLARFKTAIPRVVAALRGAADEPLGADPALAACADAPLPMLSAAQGPAAVRRAARLGLGVLYDSLQTVERTRELARAYLEAGGTATQVAIRRVWLGEAPRANEQQQMAFYRSYARSEAQTHWGQGQELIAAPTGSELAERLAAFRAASGCDGLNLRLHLGGLEPDRIREQIEAIGRDVLPNLRPSQMPGDDA